MHNDLKINDHWKLLRAKIEEIYPNATITEYGSTTCGQKVVRGPHVTVMIPAEKPVDPKGFQKVVWLIDEHLCDVEWDGKVKFGEVSGIWNGHFAELILDVKEA